MTAARRDAAPILLVDDKAERLLTYEAILEGLGERLVRARSGSEALARLEEAEFAAILLDVNMPGMDGFETARLVRDHPRGARTPIIFITGVHVTDLDRLRGYAMGAADYVYVPVVAEILRSKVQVLVELFRQRLELSRLNEELLDANAQLERAHEQLKAENTRELQDLNRSLERANTQLRSEVGERRRVEALLRGAAQRKDEFISILAHELRNPLSAIQSGVELMRLPSVPESKLTWARELLERQVKHLGRLIDDLLDVSRVTNGRVQLQREVVDLGKVVTQSIDATRALIDERGHELVLELPPEPLFVDGDIVRLTQIFGNLLANAAKYMEPGGRIHVGVEPMSAGPPRSRIRVRDEGAGLPAEMLERVFEIFTQVEPSGGRGQSGLGIGLALVRGLVELHGGSVRAASEGRGRGCEFTVELPLAQAPTRAAESGEVVLRRPEKPLRLLIIDDNVDTAEGMAHYFGQSSEHELRLAHTGSRGVSIAFEFEPNAVLLDIGLPDMDGYEVARRLRAHPALERVPLIAITGFCGERDRRRAREAGIDHFLVKPVAYPALEQLLADCANASSER